MDEEKPPRLVGSEELQEFGGVSRRETEETEDATLRPGEPNQDNEKEEGEEGGGEAPDVIECVKQKVLDVLREMREVRSEKLALWGETLRECATRLTSPPPGGDDPSSDSLTRLFQSTGEEMEEMMEKLNLTVTKLEAAVLQLPAEEGSNVTSKEPETSEEPEQVDVDSHPCDPPESDRDQTATAPARTAETLTSRLDHRGVEESKEEEKDGGGGEEEELKDEGGLSETLEKSIDHQTNSQKETEKKMTEETKGETKSDWITVGLSGQHPDALSGEPGLCFIKVAPGVATFRCEAADAFSCLMVAGSEELVSRVVRIRAEARDRSAVGFPVTVAVPFRARYRGNYRDVAVKVVDEERKASYVTPLTTEGSYGGHRGSFAEVKVYSLGLFAVVSRLKRENYTVPKRGLSLKVTMDPRVCLNYLPGSFTAPVMAQTTIQPVETVLLHAIKSRHESYGGVASTSPLLYLSHPTSRPLRRPLAVTLPCPPNPDKKWGPRGDRDRLTGPVRTSLHLGSSGHRILGASGKTEETRNESLVVLGWKENQWNVLDKVSARNQQDGLVSFDLTENYDGLLVVRLLAPLQPGLLASLAERLEESVCCHSVTVVLQRRQDEPHRVLVAAVPSRDLAWELGRLRARGGGAGGPGGTGLVVETSSEISMCEADQLLLRFSGNITSKAGGQGDQNEGAQDRLAFHIQRRNQLLLHVAEVDPFGNYSSPHYKGAVVFHRVARGQLEWRGQEGAAMKAGERPGAPVCTLPLTLPKKVRKINRPVAAREKLCEETDSLSDSLLLWLSGELSDQETSQLVASLRLRRSAAQVVRRSGDTSTSTSTSRAFRLLVTWRRGLPAVPRQPKAAQLARGLARSGRPDLARELLLRQAGTTRPTPPTPTPELRDRDGEREQYS